MVEQTTILIVDDEKNIQYAFKQLFQKMGYRVITASNAEDGLKKIEQHQPHLVFMDITMPGMSGLQALDELNRRGSEIPVVVITGYGTMKTAVQAIQKGAYDYLTKPLDVDQIRIIAGRALEMVKLRSEVKGLRAQLKKPETDQELIGQHPLMQKVYKQIGAVTTTPNDTPVLITGESGTGKELVARAIHLNSDARKEPFVAVNCTVLPKDLLENELFGHEKGAFTGASDTKRGKFEIAGRGVIFLDEIGDLPLELQTKLLRVLQEREFERLGGTTSHPVQARFITSTNRPLKKLIEQGAFRKDLFYRLNVVHIELPPLRDRKEDIPLLADHFIRKCNARFQRNVRLITKESLELLQYHDFPGNVRELEHLIERAVVLSKNDLITPDILLELDDHRAPPLSDMDSLTLEEARKQWNAFFEKKYIIQLMTRVGGNVTAAASLAGVDRRTIQRLLQKYNLSSKSFRPQ